MKKFILSILSLLMVFAFLTTVNAMNKAAPPAKEMNKAGIVATLVLTSNNNVADVTAQGGAKKVKPAWNESPPNLVAEVSKNMEALMEMCIQGRQQSSNNSNAIMMLTNANLPTPDLVQWRTSSNFNFSLNLTSMTMIPLQPGSFVIMKKPLQGVAMTSMTINDLTVTLTGGTKPFRPIKFPLQGVTSMNFVQMFAVALDTQLQNNSSSLTINPIDART